MLYHSSSKVEYNQSSWITPVVRLDLHCYCCCCFLPFLWFLTVLPRVRCRSRPLALYIVCWEGRGWVWAWGSQAGWDVHTVRTAVDTRPLCAVFPVWVTYKWLLLWCLAVAACVVVGPYVGLTVRQLGGATWSTHYFMSWPTVWLPHCSGCYVQNNIMTHDIKRHDITT